MSGMERGSIVAVALAARQCGMSYGQYVAARYYPVIIVEELPDGGKIERRAAAPAAGPLPVAGPREGAEAGRQKKPVSKKEKQKCVICGGELGPYQRKYCGDECSKRAVKERYAAQERKPYVSTAKREDRTCAVCGKLMVQVAGNKKCCSAECNRLGTRDLQRAYREQNEEPKVRYCQICGIRIGGTRWKYCDNCAGAGSEERKLVYQREYRRRKAKEAAIAAWENQEDVT